MEISREYFSMLEYAVTRLAEYYRTLQDDPVITAAAIKDYAFLYNLSDGLKHLVLIDVINCFKDLGYPRDLDTPEGLGLFMLTYDQGGKDDAIHDYERLNYLHAFGRAACQEVINVPFLT